MPVDPEVVAADQAASVAGQLSQAAGEGGTEADFRRKVAQILEAAGEAVDLTIIPKDEYSVARGFVDSLYNRLVLEYKRPGVLTTTLRSRANQDAIQQVKEYIEDVAKRERREAKRLAGVVTDGFHFIFVRRVGEGWADPELVPVNRATTERFLRLLYALSSGAALIPENLIEDFGPRQLRAQRAARALHRALLDSDDPLVDKLFEQWRLFFSEATDYKEWADRIESKKEFRGFVKGMGIDPKEADAPEVFFALHTYYALLIKLIAYLAAGRFAGGNATPLSELASKEGGELRGAFEDLERGGIFREYGIRNFLEGDFFGWYLAAWDGRIESALSGLAQRLSEYDPGTLELAPENARDLLKKLYHYLLPREIRHDLGEYYTPDWLAERLIRQTLGSDLGDPTKRVLDPACGSGTFLVLLINHVRREARRRKMGPAETLDAIRKNIIGFDLNPLAVIAARTNYLLALGDLLGESERLGPEGIDIPVYQCDSVLTPSLGKGLFEGGLYKLRTSVGVFEVPETFATKERMEVLANLMDESVEADVSEQAFMKRLSQAVDLYESEFDGARARLSELYGRLAELHREGLDGVWARIIKNAFAPLFIERCDYVVGNPPWVNWESLPEDYRRSTMPLWKHYGLFPERDKAMETILGGAKYDFSMLMTYVAMDRYLRPGGKLGFVLSQSLFKTSGAGQGFRCFCLPNGQAFCPVVVEDMVQLKPFEGASNRTAVAVFTKGRAVRYPVSYQHWKKRHTGRGSSIGFDTPYEDVTKDKITYHRWFAQPVDQGDRRSAWLTARRGALSATQKVLGRSDYSARAGSYTGGANAVYWMDILAERPRGLTVVSNITAGARKKVPQLQTAVESELLYPLLRGRDVRRWACSPTAHVLIVQDAASRCGIAVETMERTYPKAHAYLARFEDMLRRRAAFKRYFKDDAPYWSMFDIGEYTFADYKVVWPWISSRVRAAVAVRSAGKVIVPEHNTSFVSFDSEEEAHYFCAAFNSCPCEGAIMFSYCGGGGGLASPSVLERVRVPAFCRTNPVHVSMARLSRDTHGAATIGDEQAVLGLEEQVDAQAAKLWSISANEMSEIRRSIEEL